MRRLRPLLVALGVCALVGLSGCSSDLYTSCSPGEDFNCGQDESCVAQPNFQCETRVCGQFEGSRPFCTKSCTSDSECPSGKCRQFVLGRQDKYCVQSNVLKNQ